MSEKNLKNNQTKEKKKIRIAWACGYGHEHKTKAEANNCILRHLNNPNSDIEKIICIHCNVPVEIRNGTGICDHLYYPSYCKICQRIEKSLLSIREKTLRETFEMIDKNYYERVGVPGIKYIHKERVDAIRAELEKK